MPYFHYLTLLFLTVDDYLLHQNYRHHYVCNYFNLDCLKSPQSYTILTEHFLRANLNVKGEIIGNSTYSPKDSTLKSKLSVVEAFKIIMKLTYEPILCFINSPAVHTLAANIKQPIKTYLVFPAVLVL